MSQGSPLYIASLQLAGTPGSRSNGEECWEPQPKTSGRAHFAQFSYKLCKTCIACCLYNHPPAYRYAHIHSWAYKACPAHTHWLCMPLHLLFLNNTVCIHVLQILVCWFKNNNKHLLVQALLHLHSCRHTYIHRRTHTFYSYHRATEMEMGFKFRAQRALLSSQIILLCLISFQALAWGRGIALFQWCLLIYCILMQMRGGSSICREGGLPGLSAEDISSVGLFRDRVFVPQFVPGSTLIVIRILPAVQTTILLSLYYPASPLSYLTFLTLILFFVPFCTRDSI